MKMTYFKKPDHSYHRVIFEFSDNEMKAVEFKKLSFNPCRREILWILNRLTEADEKHRETQESLEKYCDTPLGVPYRKILKIKTKGNNHGY